MNIIHQVTININGLIYSESRMINQLNGTGSSHRSLDRHVFFYCAKTRQRKLVFRHGTSCVNAAYKARIICLSSWPSSQFVKAIPRSNYYTCVKFVECVQWSTKWIVRTSIETQFYVSKLFRYMKMYISEIVSLGLYFSVMMTSIDLVV